MEDGCMTLAILICTLPERWDKLKRLKNVLDPQIDRYKDRVFIKTNDQGALLPTGTKRNLLIEGTMSDYFCFIDDDDMVSACYVDEIMKALESNPDVVTFNGWYTEYGANKRNFTIRLGSKYYEDPHHPQFYYHRFPNHLAVMKRSLVNRIKFPDIWQTEDFQWAEKIANQKLLKTEHHIPQLLYHYDCYPKVNKYARRADLRR